MTRKAAAAPTKKVAKKPLRQKKPTPPAVDKKTVVIKRKVAALKQRADAYKLKAREAFGQAKEFALLLKKKGVAVDGPQVEVVAAD